MLVAFMHVYKFLFNYDLVESKWAEQANKILLIRL